jgi:hypothetical protein
MHNCDTEISKNCLDIIANISKHIQLQLVPDYQKFCERLFETLNSDVSEELESAVISFIFLKLFIVFYIQGRYTTQSYIDF